MFSLSSPSLDWLESVLLDTFYYVSRCIRFLQFLCITLSKSRLLTFIAANSFLLSLLHSYS